MASISIRLAASMRPTLATPFTSYRLMAELVKSKTTTALVLFLLLVCSPIFGQYSEQFNTPERGYLTNFMDDFSGQTWSLSSWGAGRSSTAYFKTTASGALEGRDLDEEVCWESPLFNTAGLGQVNITFFIGWTNFDSEPNCMGDYISVQRSLNGGAYEETSNLSGGGCKTIQFTSGLNHTGSGNILIPNLPANTMTAVLALQKGACDFSFFFVVH